MFFEEKRKHPRTSIRTVISYSHRSEDFTDHISNLSRGGVFIETLCPLTQGTVIALSFTLPDTGVAFHFKGRVAWNLLPGEGGGTPGMGIEFMDEREEDAKLLEEYVNRLLADG